MESQIGEADFNGGGNKKLLAILTRKQMWCEWNLRTWSLAVVPKIWINYSLPLDQSSHRLPDFRTSVPLFYILTFPLTFLNGENPSLDNSKFISSKSSLTPGSCNHFSHALFMVPLLCLAYCVLSDYLCVCLSIPLEQVQLEGRSQMEIFVLHPLGLNSFWHPVDAL